MKPSAEHHLGWWRRYDPEALDPSLTNSELRRVHILDTALTAGRMCALRTIELLEGIDIAVSRVPDYIIDPHDGRWDMLAISGNPDPVFGHAPAFRQALHIVDRNLKTRLMEEFIPILNLPDKIVAAHLNSLHITPLEYTSASGQLWLPPGFDHNPITVVHP
jgi:hypothetical protein